MDSAGVIKQLQSEGWEHVSTRGSHHKYRNPKTGRWVIVPHPKKDLPIGTVNSILKQAQLK
ncbi:MULTISPECIES: type II toxin-antitoxin system HicA family toxin [unclassified Janthinobacterium]|uniref:type II toxin-antitoxin system HicA family toxin n=1 Tax=unclassified Janthinobacterium TaxID=2610881 RepID=UPI001611BB0D|nr:MULTISPECIES: type II toxin-antitoxin system HicA family toxin [unclassified Janthinobacterium]